MGHFADLCNSASPPKAQKESNGWRVVKGRKQFIYKKKLANIESNKFKILENLEDDEGTSTSPVLENKEHAGIVTAAMVAECEEQCLGG
ncbi:hypothetical protein AMTR_s00003p00041010 [Amborella trichopoda]|uniref:Uncharacterized protein n=1 Tax=Amborella trichopoda TaxID=13333 RepID=W1P5Y8_AMBTC|nr:hypothetical protein AMTR_s00003p00041010 [Amborella trichopoda]